MLDTAAQPEPFTARTGPQALEELRPLDVIAVAALWAELMSRLGYPRFGAAGGDIGSDVSRFLALGYPERVAAVHRTDIGLPVVSGDPDGLAPEERSWLESAAVWVGTERAYASVHETKPQTEAFGLTDSPAGLAAWIVEKMRSRSDCGGDVVRFTEPARGGHFAPSEEPELYARELRDIFRPTGG